MGFLCGQYVLKTILFVRKQMNKSVKQTHGFALLRWVLNPVIW